MTRAHQGMPEYIEAETACGVTDINTIVRYDPRNNGARCRKVQSTLNKVLCTFCFISIFQNSACPNSISHTQVPLSPHSCNKPCKIILMLAIIRDTLYCKSHWACRGKEKHGFPAGVQKVCKGVQASRKRKIPRGILRFLVGFWCARGNSNPWPSD